MLFPARVTLNAQLLMFTRGAVLCEGCLACLKLHDWLRDFSHNFYSYNTGFTPTKAFQTASAGACGCGWRRKENISTFRRWKRYKRCFNGPVAPKAINYDRKPLMRIWRKMGKTKQCKANGKLVNYKDVVVQGSGTEVRKAFLEFSCLGETQQVVQCEL